MTDFVTLQMRMKRDPPGYREDFLQQCRHFMSNLQIFKLQPIAKAGRSQAETATIFDHNQKKREEDKKAGGRAPATSSEGPVQSRRLEEFCALIAFISYTCHYYTKEVQLLNIPQELYALLFQHCEALDPVLRKTLVQALVLFQNKGFIRRLDLLPALFRCFRCADKELRQSVFLHICSDLQKLSKTNPSLSMTTALQKLIFGMLREDHPGVALKALYILVEMWKRNVWVTPKIVQAITSLSFHTDNKLVAGSLHFFLGNYDTSEEEDEQNREIALTKQREIGALNFSIKHIGRRMKKQREVDRAKKQIKKAQKALDFDEEDMDSDQEREHRMKSANTNPLSMLYDAQQYAERLFYKLKTSRELFSTRMLMMDVLSKIIGMNKLLIFNFFPFIQRYLQPHQRHVTGLLVYAARATHNLVPPEVLNPLIKTIANHFVTDRSTPEVIAVGINSIREICSRAPLVMTEELLHDISEYSRHKNKGIMNATRSLIQVFRELNPALLRRKDRGREAQMQLSIMAGPGDEAAKMRDLANAKLAYGAQYVSRDIDGVDMLIEAGVINEENGNWDDQHGMKDFDVDEVYNQVYGVEEDDEDDDGVGSKNSTRLLLTRHELKKFRRKRGKELVKYKRFIYQKYGISDGQEIDEDGNDMIDAAIAANDMKRMKMLEKGEIEEDDEDNDDDEDDEMDVEGVFGEGDEMGLEMESMDMSMFMEGEGDMDFDMEGVDDEDMMEEEAEDEDVPMSKKAKTGSDIADKIVQLADVAPVVAKASIRILTPADFQKLELLREKRQEEGLRGARKRQKDMLNADILAQQQKMLAHSTGSYADVDEGDLQSTHIKKTRLTKSERMLKLRESQEEIKKMQSAMRVTKFGHRVKADNLGLSNEEKRNTKNFMMIKQSRKVRAKATRGFKEKIANAAGHIKTVRKMGKNLKKSLGKRGRSKAGL